MKSDAPYSSPSPVPKAVPGGKRPHYLPQEFQFTIGGFCGPCHEVALVAGHLRCRSAVGACRFGSGTIRRPSREQWEEFWCACDAIGVWNWSRSYDNPGICDGTQWSLKIKHAGHPMRCKGSNAFPGALGPGYSRACPFGRFLSALRKLTGLSELQ